MVSISHAKRLLIEGGNMGFFESKSTKEKKSHFRNLVLMAFADGQFQEGEQQLLASIGGRMGLSPAEVSEVLSKPQKIKLRVPSDRSEKISQMVDLVGMMMVDGNIDQKEYLLCMAFAKQMGLDPGIVKVISEKMVEALKKGLSTDSAVNDLNSILG